MSRDWADDTKPGGIMEIIESLQPFYFEYGGHEYLIEGIGSLRDNSLRFIVVDPASRSLWRNRHRETGTKERMGSWLDINSKKQSGLPKNGFGFIGILSSRTSTRRKISKI
jgi:hypothetical protein